MSQKFIKMQNKNTRSTAYGKYFAKAIYDKAFGNQGSGRLHPDTGICEAK